jgi:predicted porin
MNKKLLAIAISTALAVPMAAQAVSFKVGGHINRVVQFTDDGVASDVRQADNTQSSSRINIRGSEDLGIGGMKVGVYTEFELSSNRSISHAMKGAGNTDATVGMRHSAIWFGGKFGTIWAGQTNTAYNGALGRDFGGPLFLAGNAFDTESLNIGATQFRTAANGFSGVTVGNVSSGFHGNRNDTLRYDSPRFGPVHGAISVEENEQWTMRLNADGSMSGARWAIGGGYREGDNALGFSQWGINAALGFSQGTSLKVTYSERDFQAAGRTSADNLYLKLAHSWGNNSIGIDYVQTDDMAQANDDYTGWGVGFVHSIPGPRVQLFAGYRNHDLDRPGTGLQDIDQFNVGARVQF